MGLVDILDGQRVAGAIRALEALGVEPSRVGTDRFRQFGRGRVPKVSELCGKCGNGVAAIGPDGQVWLCIMARWIVAGNVRTSPLAELLEAAVVPELVAACNPSCEPACRPADCRPIWDPCYPTARTDAWRSGTCDPDGDCTPGYGDSGCGPRT